MLFTWCQWGYFKLTKIDIPYLTVNQMENKKMVTKTYNVQDMPKGSVVPENAKNIHISLSVTPELFVGTENEIALAQEITHFVIDTRNDPSTAQQGSSTAGLLFIFCKYHDKMVAVIHDKINNQFPRTWYHHTQVYKRHVPPPVTSSCNLGDLLRSVIPVADEKYSILKTKDGKFRISDTETDLVISVGVTMDVVNRFLSDYMKIMSYCTGLTLEYDLE